MLSEESSLQNEIVNLCNRGNSDIYNVNYQENTTEYEVRQEKLIDNGNNVYDTGNFEEINEIYKNLNASYLEKVRIKDT